MPPLLCQLLQSLPKLLFACLRRLADHPSAAKSIRGCSAPDDGSESASNALPTSTAMAETSENVIASGREPTLFLAFIATVSGDVRNSFDLCSFCLPDGRKSGKTCGTA